MSVEGPFCHFNAILQNPGRNNAASHHPELGRGGVHTKVHMRDLPPPRETRSAAALIGVRDIGHRKSEPVIASVRGVDLLTNKPRKMGNVGGSSKPA
ncbi:hypothetical protein CFAM422_000636 [Trichoderma lentiforme]|uniref:Uncharacterized protein n=1 Tax=Trichoderma lentiforme TaxID=1567552 RepID=A0A9P4XR89_9HYPO|nr:hypothetical protein CFAM422_000636 [Trichoderma lentiforme]